MEEIETFSPLVAMETQWFIFYRIFSFCFMISECFQMSYDRDQYHPDFDDGVLTEEAIFQDEERPEIWQTQAQETLFNHVRHIDRKKIAKNVILFIGDGMSIPTIGAARILSGQKEGLSGEQCQLEFEKFPVSGLAKTYCLNYQVGDSACTATAYLCGVKARYGTIGVDGTVAKGDCLASLNASRRVDSIAKWAIDAGKTAGIVTTARVTHASPAATYAHTCDRNWESDSDVTAAGSDPKVCRDIAHQLVHGLPGMHFKVILGGGRQMFRSQNVEDEEGIPGTRADGRDLIDEWLQGKEAKHVNCEYVWNRQQLQHVTDLTSCVLGLFEPSHMQFNINADRKTEPSLEELVEAAINMLSKNEEGYFLFVEGGRIDHAHHATWARTALDETIQLSKAVEKAVNMTSPEDTLLVVTADHSHTMSFSGYALRGGDIVGETGFNVDDGSPYTVLSYANGPASRLKANADKTDVSPDDISQTTFEFPSLVSRLSETHAGDDVSVYAFGPWQTLFTGVYEQNAIPHFIGYASCLGPGRTVCNDIL